MHLTNYSVNKHAEAYVKNQDKDGPQSPSRETCPAEDESGDDEPAQASKWSLADLTAYFI